jgi:energy-coupling factor transporter ATP-binding protein EcfA2
MQNNYTPSVNIIRDADRNINYKPTPNAQRAVDKIVNEFRIGKRSFNIIGSYGTGKSSFLWALQQSIKGNKPFFEVKYFQEAKTEIINLVGEYKSFANCLAEYFAVEGDNSNYKNIFAEIFQRYHALGKKRPLLLIVVDEFGKFLEYAAKNSPEQELYFFQQFAEFINNPDHNILLITTVHQNFDAYAFGLADTQKQEWTKVKGRFEEITFNEPVEQLIFLASEQLSQNADYQIDCKKIKEANNFARVSVKKYIP